MILRPQTNSMVKLLILDIEMVDAPASRHDPALAALVVKDAVADLEAHLVVVGGRQLGNAITVPIGFSPLPDVMLMMSL
jgi:hypothetical protein